MLRRTELLSVAFDPDALSKAYARIVKKFPEQRQWVHQAAERIVEILARGV